MKDDRTELEALLAEDCAETSAGPWIAVFLVAIGLPVVLRLLHQFAG